MPFARRVVALRSGEIDIMVGLKDGHQENGDFVYLAPSYSVDKAYLFILAENRPLITESADLDGKLIGATIDEHDKYKPEEQWLHGAKLIPVSLLQQKIDMLLLGRTDLFKHFLFSAQRAIEKRQLSDRVVLAQYQRPEMTHYYFALSTKSAHFSRRNELQDIIAKELAKGSFQQIMSEHYKMLDTNSEAHSD